jgi:hypothetical protein
VGNVQRSATLKIRFLASSDLFMAVAYKAPQAIHASFILRRDGEAVATDPGRPG